MFDDKVMCPYHAASYSVVTGVAENAPGRDGLETYEVVEEKGRFFAVVPEALQKKKQLPMAKRDPKDNRNFVIIGGGIAGLNAAETLRFSGYTGKITMINAEKLLPYDRTMLTKQLATGKAEDLVLRDKEWFKEADIEVLHDKVYSIHTDKKKLALERGQALDYDKLLIATGGSVRKS